MCVCVCVAGREGGMDKKENDENEEKERETQ